MGCESNIGRRSGNWGSQIDYKKINEEMVARIQEFNNTIYLGGVSRCFDYNPESMPLNYCYYSV